MRKHPHRFLKAATLLATGGALFQAAGCNEEASQVLAGAVAGLTTSIVNTFLSLYIGELFGTGGFGF